MSLQDLAIKAVEALSTELDPLVKRYGFNVKLRHSNPEVYSEVLGYEIGAYEVEITACLHPHDYPQQFSVRFIEKMPGAWRYANLEELLELFKDRPKQNHYIFPISTSEQLSDSCKKLAGVMNTILSNKLYKNASSYH